MINVELENTPSEVQYVNFDTFLNNDLVKDDLYIYIVVRSSRVRGLICLCDLKGTYNGLWITEPVANESKFVLLDPGVKITLSNRK